MSLADCVSAILLVTAGLRPVGSDKLIKIRHLLNRVFQSVIILNYKQVTEWSSYSYSYAITRVISILHVLSRPFGLSVHHALFSSAYCIEKATKHSSKKKNHHIKFKKLFGKWLLCSRTIDFTMFTVFRIITTASVSISTILILGFSIFMPLSLW